MMVRYKRATESVYSDLPLSVNHSTNNREKSSKKAPPPPPKPKVVTVNVYSEKSKSSNNYQYIETGMIDSYVEVNDNEYEDTPFLSGVKR